MAAPFRIFIPKPEDGEFQLSDLSKKDSATLTDVLNSYAGHIVTCGIGRSRPTIEEKEAQQKEKAQKKADRAKVAAEKATAKIKKAQDKAKTAQEALDKITKTAAGTATEKKGAKKASAKK